MATIEKKTWPEAFEAVLSGKKKYDLRLNDFEIHEGDTLFLREWNPETKTYTGRSVEKKAASVRKFDINAQQYWPKEEVLKKGLQIISFE